MNQGIFGFRKYENSSLSYTGIDMHEGEAVGGWDTVLRREEYEALYSKQQATIADLTDAISPTDTNTQRKTSNIVRSVTTTHKPVVSQPASEIDWNKILASVSVGTIVNHKTFGDGIVVWMDNAKKHIRVKFANGEKPFIFPNAFTAGFLHLPK